MRLTEGNIHVAMRRILVDYGWTLIAGEFPGGSDHELYPLNVTDPTVARDNSPAPRHHSSGELIPDVVALRGRKLLIGEAKVKYDEGDRQKLARLIGERRDDLIKALDAFAERRSMFGLRPIRDLIFYPTLVFSAEAVAPAPAVGWSYLRIISPTEGQFQGALDESSVR